MSIPIPKFCKDCKFRSFRSTDFGHGSNFVEICIAPQNEIVSYDLVSGEETREYNSCKEARADFPQISKNFPSCKIEARWFIDRVQEVVKQQSQPSVNLGTKKTFNIGTDL